MKKHYKFALWIFILSLSFGFRVFPGKWEITKEDPTIWVKLCDSQITVDENDITGDDALSGLTNLTLTQVLQTVIDDYNNNPTSFLRLALYPSDPNNPGAPATGDSTFTTTKAEKRTIDICFENTNPAAGLSSGHAQAKYENNGIVGCEIKARKENTKKAKFLTHLLTHELGHCFGLMHPQESTHSVMSYFYGDLIYRLQNDDLAGLTFKYPDDESYANETYTLGLSGCSPKKN